MERIFRFPGGRDVGPSGAVGRNRSGMWKIEEQRTGGDWIFHGVLSGRADWKEIGWRVLKWGCDQQQASGRFPSSGADFHSSSFFIEALARATNVDRIGSSPASRSALQRGTDWLIASEAEGLRSNYGLTHRYYLQAAALAQSSVALSDPDIMKVAVRWACRGMKQQLPNGINPEMKLIGPKAGQTGFDVSYQMVGILFALRFLSVCDNSTLINELKRMIRKAGDWWIARIKSDGTVSLADSTRVGIETGRDGRLKGLDTRSAFLALIYGAQVLQDHEWIEAAIKIRPTVSTNPGL
ncbi:hypothetical protein [Novosphingobium cyanobacteriorum]|uniref:Alpha-macroglobulin-like TED domain-containing protein n=1 Tax=Novosphingobium cyanobacteriorum TaxID=3024215 RepID=A0ABT6CMA1_9SPHN|nr:hypothetical protein [Novosphingobium cyanobacteriorum]MDF8334992.1 hypothetical protein [Novosphingobium cyanobacteriorum]